MSAAALAGAVLVTCALLAYALNHMLARVALVEVALNEGLPPGFETAPSSLAFDFQAAAATLAGGLHLFLSRSCHACQSLVDELGADHTAVGDLPVVVHHIGVPRDGTIKLVDLLGAGLELDQLATASRLGIDPLPHAIAIGPKGLIAHGAVPTTADLDRVARDGGLFAALAP